MTNTRDKLLETRYFLERMREEQANRDPFRYNLTAFLSAARSVTYFMQKEFKGAPGFAEWYAKQQARMKSDKVMSFLNNRRVMTVHQQPIQLNALVNVDIGGTITTTGNLTIRVIRASGTTEEGHPPMSPPPTSPRAPTQNQATATWRWYFQELADKDIVTVCDEHIAKLEAVVAEWEARFAKIPRSP